MAESDEARVPLLSRLRPAPGAVTPKRRVGRGVGSGLGKTCGKGQKGQKARGTMKRLGFQGGQMPLQRRLPKLGFNNIFSVRYAPVNVGDLAQFAAGSTVDEAALRKARLVRGHWDGVKILGNGELPHALSLKVNGVSSAAREKIEKVGGSLEVLPRPVRGPRREDG